MLEKVSFMHNTSLVDIAPLASLHRLHDLTLRGCTNLVDASPLTQCKALRYADFGDCTSLVNVPGCPTLAGIDLSGCTAVRNLVPLMATEV